MTLESANICSKLLTLRAGEAPRLRHPGSHRILRPERVSVILRRCATGIVEGWLARTKQSSDLMVVPLSDEQRAVHIPRLVEDLTVRLSKSSAAMNDCDAIFSAAAVAHGKLRYLQGYTPAMLVDESRILEVTIFGMLQSNRHSLDVTLLLLDVMAIADEVDAQLTQSIGGYNETHEGKDSCLTHRKANTHFKDNK